MISLGNNLELKNLLFFSYLYDSNFDKLLKDYMPWVAA